MSGASPNIAELTPLAPATCGDQELITELEARLETRPDNARAWYDLGCARNRAGLFEDAAHALQYALVVSPYNLSVQGELAVAFAGMGCLGEAGSLFETVIHKDPGNGWAYLQLGLVRFRQDAVRESVQCWECATRLLEDPSDSLENLSMAYRRLGEHDEERHAWRRLYKHAPDHPSVRHMLAATGDAPLTERADDAYLRHLFDRFAADFDGVLRTVDYRVPEQLEAHFGKICGPPSADLDILDAGCGTGLCGERVRPWARRLVGVDISKGMLAKAKERGVYDEHAESELVAFLESVEETFDWVISADVLCYFGDLRGVVASIVRRLRFGGRFFLTVEKSPDDACALGRQLQSHGRYCHTQAHVEAAAQAAGAEVEEIYTNLLRLEAREPVVGVYAILRRSSG